MGKKRHEKVIKPVNWRRLLNAPISPAMRRAAVLAALAAAPVAGHAGGGMTGGALEITQLINKAELISQTGEAVQTTSNTLMTAQTTMQQLRQLAPGTISQMSGLPIDQVQKLADAYVVMIRSRSAYDDAEQVMRKAAADAERLGITPSELLRLKAEAAAKHGGIYQQTYEDEQAKMKRLTDVSKDVQQQAQQVQSIDANVKGIQFLATQNVKVQASLASIDEEITKANMNAAQAAAKEQAERERSAMREKAVLDARRKAEAEAPPVGRLKLPGDFNSK